MFELLHMVVHVDRTEVVTSDDWTYALYVRRRRGTVLHLVIIMP